MRLTLKYLQLTSQGIYRYRRRVPDRLRSLVGRNELVRKLGETEQEALRHYPAVHSRAERLLGDATRTLSQLQAEGIHHRLQEPQTALTIRSAAEQSLRNLGFDITGSGFGLDDDLEEVHRSIISEDIAAKYPRDPETGYPIGVVPIDTEIVRILNSTIPPQAPPPTFNDAARLYVEEKIQGQINARQNTNRVVRVSKIVQSALGRDPVLTGLKKKDAREVRDHMLSDMGIRPSTTRRYLNDIRAIINFGIDQYDLTGVSNPFTRLGVKTDAVSREARRSFTADELQDVRAHISHSASKDLKLIWTLLEGSGCRLAEVTGLLASDVILDRPIPHLKIQQHSHRRLKTKGAARTIPLVGDALAAAKDAVKECEASSPLFPRYAIPRGSDRASAALMKHVRAVVSDPKVTVHSLRHLMKDRLRLAGVPEGVQDSILGHSSGRVAEAYGGPEARLKLMREGLLKALDVTL